MGMFLLRLNGWLTAATAAARPHVTVDLNIFTPLLPAPPDIIYPETSQNDYNTLNLTFASTQQLHLHVSLHHREHHTHTCV